ncbi:MAG TPA: addiction module protein [Planctomycetota bacterium]|nr:addiction module protein [Planctomycetota bacterium]
MTKKTRALLEQALKLSQAERVELMDGLAASFEAEDGSSLSPEWIEEIERRVEGILSGERKGIPLEKVIKKLRRAQERDDRARGKAPSR